MDFFRGIGGRPQLLSKTLAANYSAQTRNMEMNRIFAAIAISVMLSGCQTAPQKLSVSSAFDSAQAQSLLVEGPNNIRGSALIRQRGGGVISCAGREVVLVPATTYASERIGALYGSVARGYNPAGIGGRRFSFDGEPLEYRQLQRRTMCDAQGFFKFEKVASGTFYVITVITWEVGNSPHEGGALMQRVSLTGGESQEVVLAP